MALHQMMLMHAQKTQLQAFVVLVIQMLTLTVMIGIKDEDAEDEIVDRRRCM